MKILVVLSFVLLMLGTGAVEGRGAAPFTTLLFRRKCTAKQASSKACASGGTCYAFCYYLLIKHRKPPIARELTSHECLDVREKQQESHIALLKVEVLRRLAASSIAKSVTHGKQTKKPVLAGGLVTLFGTHMTGPEFCVVFVHGGAAERGVKNVTLIMARGYKRKLELEAIKDN
ncbi:hypothetical protein ACROYT_G035862 [Oculina patagonica]